LPTERQCTAKRTTSGLRTKCKMHQVVEEHVQGFLLRPVGGISEDRFPPLHLVVELAHGSCLYTSILPLCTDRQYDVDVRLLRFSHDDLLAHMDF